MAAGPRTALITGGASGFGLAIARALVRQGANVAIFDLRADALEVASGELGGAVLAVRGDVTRASEVRAAVDRCVETFGGLDTLVVSAGVIHIKELHEVTEADWDRTLDVNLKGAFLSAQAAAPALRASGRGRIVSIGSDASKRGADRILAYSASKFGLVGLTHSLAAELAVDQVTVNCVCPVGCPTTGMGQQVADWKSAHAGLSAEQVVAAAARTNPLGRNATENDVAGTVMFLISDAASFITGVALDVDGGAHVGFLPGAADE
ncbi:MAG: meso-butanediol dehydrogenase / (S,S)-butanediol dehydrogenase / diacetyl reductase [Gaiellaceae bacterium]|nr:meso-butanediol dehydrogenase / (S,S)-butanediol dehydrogenase / diacetyl reductase [Gaiellaceae bacterium]